VDEAVLAATVELLGEVGYADLTVEDVAARARVSKASLYLRWPGKVALVADALGYRSAMLPDVPDKGSLHDDMRLFLRALVRSHEAGFALAASAVSGEVMTNPDLRDAFRHSLITTVSQRVAVIVGRAVARGELAANTDVEMLSLLPMAVLQHVRLADEPRADPAKVVDRIVDQFYSPDPSPRRKVTGRTAQVRR
jgi:AcrR family transcriptional regulator